MAGAVGTAAILGISIAVAFATQPKVPSASDGSQPLRQSIPPRPFGYGRTRIAGAYMLFEVDPANFDSFDVLALHQGRVEELIHIYLHDDIVTVNGGTGFVSGLHTADPADNRYGSLTANRVHVQTRAGLATETAYSNTVTALPTLWSNAHRGDGVASLALRCLNVTSASVQDVYPRGLPRPSVVADLSPVWDPRDPSQVRTDPATWKAPSNPVLQALDYHVSPNPVLQLLDYLTHSDRGPALDYDTLIAPRLADWMVEADICEEAVAKADGHVEARYTSNGWAFLSTDPAEVIGAILATCDGWLAEAGDGTLALTVGKYRAPGITLTDDHIVGFTINKGVADEESVNEVQFSYTSPQGNWRDAPGVAVRDESAIAEMGMVRSDSLKLAWVQCHSQGRRLAKRALARHTAAARGQLVTTLYGLKALGQRWVRVQSGEVADLADAVIEISRVRIDLANAALTFDWVLVNPNSIDAWDPDTEEGVAPSYFPLPANVTAADAGVGNQINVEFDKLDPLQPWLYYVVEVRTGGPAADWLRFEFEAKTQLVDLGGGRVRLQTGAVATGTYQVRIAALGRQTYPNTVTDPDLVWAPSNAGVTGVVIS